MYLQQDCLYSACSFIRTVSQCIPFQAIRAILIVFGTNNFHLINLNRQNNNSNRAAPFVVGVADAAIAIVAVA